MSKQTNQFLRWIATLICIGALVWGVFALYLLVRLALVVL